MNPNMLEALSGKIGCDRLSAEFYSRVGGDPALHRLFPGKSLRCATEEFSAFLVHFLDGDEDQTQKRWWLSLRESHARFEISAAERRAWLTHMSDALDSVPLDPRTRQDLRRFFGHSSSYVASDEPARPEDGELAVHWAKQLRLDDAVGAIAAGRAEEAIVLTSQFGTRPSVFVGLLARMVKSDNSEMLRFVIESVENDPSIATKRFAGRSLIHFAAEAGSTQVVELLLRLGIDPDTKHAGSHTALYCVANECGSRSGGDIVRLLVRAGANVNACDGMLQATPLHMAARRGFVEIANALLDCGAAIDARDRKGVTPLQRAVNCRKSALAKFFVERGASESAAALEP